MRRYPPPLPPYKHTGTRCRTLQGSPLFLAPAHKTTIMAMPKLGEGKQQWHGDTVIHQEVSVLACMRRQHTSSGWMAAMTVTAAPPAMTPRSAGPGDVPSYILRYMDRPVS